MLSLDEKETNIFKDLYFKVYYEETKYKIHRDITIYSKYNDCFKNINLPKDLINIIIEYTNEKYRLHCEITNDILISNQSPVLCKLFDENNNQMLVFRLIFFRQKVTVQTNNFEIKKFTNLKYGLQNVLTCLNNSNIKETIRDLYHSCNTKFKYELTNNIEINIFTLFFNYFISMIVAEKY